MELMMITKKKKKKKMCLCGFGTEASGVLSYHCVDKPG